LTRSKDDSPQYSQKGPQKAQNIPFVLFVFSFVFCGESLLVHSKTGLDKRFFSAIANIALAVG
jgi:hypothetical protein